MHSCNSFYFYIKPQHKAQFIAFCACCNSFYFYIKPQPLYICPYIVVAVIHSISTSNHNHNIDSFDIPLAVIHSISTSNHNLGFLNI